jgi:hypothetical protein
MPIIRSPWLEPVVITAWSITTLDSMRLANGYLREGTHPAAGGQNDLGEALDEYRGHPEKQQEAKHICQRSDEDR